MGMFLSNALCTTIVDLMMLGYSLATVLVIHLIPSYNTRVGPKFALKIKLHRDNCVYKG